jgi:hypothetical protein
MTFRSFYLLLPFLLSKFKINFNIYLFILVMSYQDGSENYRYKKYKLL